MRRISASAVGGRDRHGAGRAAQQAQAEHFVRAVVPGPPVGADDDQICVLLRASAARPRSGECAGDRADLGAIAQGSQLGLGVGEVLGGDHAGEQEPRAVAGELLGEPQRGVGRRRPVVTDDDRAVRHGGWAAGGELADSIRSGLRRSGPTATGETRVPAAARHG